MIYVHAILNHASIILSLTCTGQYSAGQIDDV